MKKLVMSFMLILSLFMLVGCGKSPVEQGLSTPNGEVDTNTETVKKDNVKKVELGGNISLDILELTLDNLEVKSNYTFFYVDNSGNITVKKNAYIKPASSDFKLVTLKGKFTNKYSKEIYPTNSPMYGVMKINGNEYKTTMSAYNVKEAESFMGIVPQQTVDYFFYAEVPASVADNIESCEVKFGFDKEFSPIARDFNELEYVYSLNAIPSK